MSRLPLFALVSLASSTLFAAPEPVAFDWFEYTGDDAVFEQPLAEGQYRNPILAGFYPDPSICRVGDDYYLINSTFAYFPGIPIFHSRDLVNWKQIGHVIHRPEQLKYEGLGVSRAIFAPAISHHKGTFYVVCTMVDGGGNFLVTATDPAGPWSDPIWFDFEGIDPSLCFMEDGRAWMLNNGAPEGEPLYEGHRAIWIQQFDIAKKQLIGPRKVIVNGGVDISTKPVWIEGPHLYQRDGWYYVCAAEGGTSVNHSQVILRSKKPTGPFQPWAHNPILTQRDLDGNAPGAVTSTGHADLVIGPDGSWWSIFLACRPYQDNDYITGRETFLLPVTWTKDGWPRILEPGVRVPLVHAVPGGAKAQVAPARASDASEAAHQGLAQPSEPGSLPLTGNFTWRDEFASATLSSAWIMLRAPKETWWTLDPTDSRLSLAPRTETLLGTANPSYLARRVQHTHFKASTSLEVPANEGVSAGLVVFQGEKHHFFLGVRRSGADATLFLEKVAGSDAPVVVASTNLSPAPATVNLRAVVDKGTASFFFSSGFPFWNTLVPATDARLLTTEVAGGFVGATVGVYARQD